MNDLKVTVATLCMVMLGLFFAVGCKKDPVSGGGTGSGPNDGGEEIEYPINIPFTEYSLSETCQWTNLGYDNTVIVINSDEELENYIVCSNGSSLEIDFSKQSLLFVFGSTPTEINVIKKQLHQISNNGYRLSVEVLLNDAMRPDKWIVALITNKLNVDSNIELSVTLIN